MNENSTLGESILLVTSQHSLDKMMVLQRGQEVAKKASIGICAVATVLNVTVIWSTTHCILHNINHHPCFIFIANLAFTDLLSSIWFLLAATVEDYAWTDLTIYMTLFYEAEERGIITDPSQEIDFVRLTIDNCLDHLMVFALWMALLLLSIDRFIYITNGLKHPSIFTTPRIRKLLAFSWALVLLLSAANLGHLHGVIPWLRRLISGFWQLMFWITVTLVFFFYVIILYRRAKSVRKLHTDLFLQIESQESASDKGVHNFLALSRSLKSALNDVKNSKYVLAILSSIFLSWVPSMVLLTTYTLYGLDPTIALLFHMHYDTEDCQQFQEFSQQPPVGEAPTQNIFDLSDCLMSYRGVEADQVCQKNIYELNETRRDFAIHGYYKAATNAKPAESLHSLHKRIKVYNDVEQLCLDARMFQEDLDISNLSTLLMQFFCLNSFINPLIYAFSFSVFRETIRKQLGFFRRKSGNTATFSTQDVTFVKFWTRW